MPTNFPGGYPQQLPAAPGSQPPGAPYAAPYVAPWSPPPGGFTGIVAPPPTRRPRTMGVAAFLAALVAAIVAPALFAVGYGPLAPLLVERVDRGADPFADLGWLAPVAASELLAELALYAGTIAGFAAIVVGIIAIAQRRGRAWGVWAIVIAVLAPVVMVGVFFVITLGAVIAIA